MRASGAAQRRRLDLRTAQFGNAAFGADCQADHAELSPDRAVVSNASRAAGLFVLKLSIWMQTRCVKVKEGR